MHNMLLKYIVFALIIGLFLKAVPNNNMDNEKIIKIVVVGTLVMFLMDRFLFRHGFGFGRGYGHGRGFGFGFGRGLGRGHRNFRYSQQEGFEGCTAGGMTDVDMLLDAGTMPELRPPMHVQVPPTRMAEVPSAIPVPTVPIPAASNSATTPVHGPVASVANLAPANVPSAAVPSVPVVFEMEDEEEGEEEQQNQAIGNVGQEQHMQALIDLAHATGPFQEQQQEQQGEEEHHRLGVEGMDVVTMTQPGSPKCDGPVRFPRKYNFTYLDEDYANTGLRFDNNQPDKPLLQQCGFSQRIAPLSKMHQIIDSQRYNTTDETKPGYYLSNNGRYSCGDVPYSKVGNAICASKFNDLYNQYNHVTWSPHTHLGKARGYLNWEKFY